MRVARLNCFGTFPNVSDQLSIGDVLPTHPKSTRVSPDPRKSLRPPESGIPPNPSYVPEYPGSKLLITDTGSAAPWDRLPCPRMWTLPQNPPDFEGLKTPGKRHLKAISWIKSFAPQLCRPIPVSRCARESRIPGSSRIKTLIELTRELLGPRRDVIPGSKLLIEPCAHIRRVRPGGGRLSGRGTGRGRKTKR